MNEFEQEMMRVETVNVVGENGKPLRVNKSQYDANPERYELATAAIPASVPLVGGAPVAKGKKGKAAKPSDGTAETFQIVSENGRFFVADADGEKIEDDARFDAVNGYDDDVAAWTATTKPAT